jgi:hypothetical protein
MKIEFPHNTPMSKGMVSITTDSEGVIYEHTGTVISRLQIRWADITAAGTAILDLSPEAAAIPTAATYLNRTEMFAVAYRDSGGRTQEASFPLPSGEDGNAFLAEARSQLGARWVGENIPYAAISQHLGVARPYHKIKIWLFILGVAIVAALALLAGGFVLGLLLNPYVLSACLFAIGALLFRHGFIEYRNRLTVKNTPTAQASSAAVGLAELFGCARGGTPTLAPISGKPSIFWSVLIRQNSRVQRGKGEWHVIAKRGSEPLELLELEDETGRIPVWCHGAELLLGSEQWRSKKDKLPEGGKKLLDELGRKWPLPSDANQMEITEKRLEEGGPLYVMGTLSERRRIPSPAQRSRPIIESRKSLSAIPGLARIMLTQWMRNKMSGGNATPPDLEPHRVLVWKGDSSRPFIISNKAERATLTALTKRIWRFLLLGGGLMAYALYGLLDTLGSK